MALNLTDKPGRVGTLSDLVLQQAGAGGFGATECAAEAYELNAAFEQFGADFINGAVGVRQQQYIAVGACEFFLHGGEHAVGGLACARRSYNQIQIAGCGHTHGKVVEWAVVAVELNIGAYFRTPAQQQQVAPGYGGFKKRVHAAVERTVRRLDEIVLYGPEAAASGLERRRARLGRAQPQTDVAGGNILDGAAEHHVAPGIGHFAGGVRVENHNVAAEVGHVAGFVVGESQPQ